MSRDDHFVRSQKFRLLRENKPGPGVILESMDGSEVPVYVEHKCDDNSRVMYTNALIDDACTGWYLTSDICGLKVLILPRSQARLIETNGHSEDKLSVAALRVVRHTDKGTALIAEVLGGY
jgi:hypothetical protein